MKKDTIEDLIEIARYALELINENCDCGECGPCSIKVNIESTIKQAEEGK